MSSSSQLDDQLSDFLDKSFETNYVRDWTSPQVLTWLKLCGLETTLIKSFSKLVKNLNGEYIYKNVIPLEEVEIFNNFPFISKFGYIRKLFTNCLKLRKNLYHLEKEMIKWQVIKNPELISKKKKKTTPQSDGGGGASSLFKSVSNSLDEDDDIYSMLTSNGSNGSLNDSGFLTSPSSQSHHHSSFIEYGLLPSHEIANFLKRKKIFTNKEHLNIIIDQQVEGDVFVTMTSTKDWMTLCIFHYSQVFVNESKDDIEKVYEQTCKRHPTMPNMEQILALKNVTCVIVNK